MTPSSSSHALNHEDEGLPMTNSTIKSRRYGLSILSSLEDLKNRLMADGRDNDADVVRVAALHVENHLQAILPTYVVRRPEDGWRKRESFTAREKLKLRPIAETLAMLDGNAFFGSTKDEAGNDTWYEGYLAQAASVWDANGGDNGWSGASSMTARIMAG